MGSADDQGKNGNDYADARLAAIVDSSFDAIISKDLNSIIVSWNVAAERLFGYTADEAVGQSILMLIPERFHSEETDIISRIKRGEQVATFETIRKRKDGSLVPVSLTISPIRNKNGQIIGASKIARDISAARESERRIKLLMREVNHRVKNQFAVILSMVRETIKRSVSPQEFEETIRERIMALSRSHDLLVTSDWSGASLFDLIQEHLKPFGHEERVTLAGPLITLLPNAVQHLGMAFHELGTNSAKYGALKGETGSISVRWSIGTGDKGAQTFSLTWDEVSSGLQTAETNNPARKGFGSIVLQRVAPQALDGAAMMERELGQVRWTLTSPASAVLYQPNLED